jgi:hypothetical protein
MQNEQKDLIKETSTNVVKEISKQHTITNGFMLQTIKVDTKSHYSKDKYKNWFSYS